MHAGRESSPPVRAIPSPVAPMAPTLVRPPFHRDGWVYEEKVDGWRRLAYKDGPRVRLISRDAVDHTARFRELAAAIAKLRADVLVLDGEIAIFDKELVSRFHLLGDDDTRPVHPADLSSGSTSSRSGVGICAPGRSQSGARSSKTSSTATRWCCRVAGCQTMA